MFEEKELSRKTVYEGRIVTLRSDVAELVNGKQVKREVVEHPGGVCIVPVDEAGYCYLVRQFRYPFQTSLLEFPAGKLEHGEDPLLCAIRELSEETGLSAGSVMPLGQMYPSPGYLDEVIHLYLARDLTQGEAHPDENEFLSVERHSIEALCRMVTENKLPDAKTVVALFKTMQYMRYTL